MDLKLFVKKYPQEGDLQHTYSPLKNLVNEDSSIVDFNTTELSIDLNNPLNIECQPSYDGTVNLIINDDKNPPRIINSRFTKIENGRFKIINRNQLQQSNLYKKGIIDLQSRLFRTITKIPKLNFVELNYFGQLKGGNYTFYIKYADSDFNKTDIVCESAQIPIFKGNLSNIKSISGTLADERTDKSIKLILENIDTSFNKFYIYYSREYSDTNGFRLSESGMITNPYTIDNINKEIIINGFEDVTPIDDDQLNIKYNFVTNVKTQAQVQNMLFFGNVQGEQIDVKNLQNISYFFEVKLKQKEKSIGWIDQNYQPNSQYITSLEYYDPKNVYYNLGYWPGELYRLGVVYIMNDDSLSPVFNLRGREFKSVSDDDSNLKNVPNNNYWIDKKKHIINYLERDKFISNSKNFDNTFGVFKNPEEEVKPIHNYIEQTTNPWYYEIGFNSELKNDLILELKKFGVKGYFFVRQKRIPITLCQGLSLGVDIESSTPMLYDESKKTYFSESFLQQTEGPEQGELNDNYENHKVYTDSKKGSALISIDACSNPNLQSILDGSEFMLQKLHSKGNLIQNGRKCSITFSKSFENTYSSFSCVFINQDTPYKFINNFGFSSKAGTEESVKSISFFGRQNKSNKEDASNTKIIRGSFSPYIGVCGNLENNCIYNIRIQNYSSMYIKDYFKIRGNDSSPFYAISDRFEVNDLNKHDIYRGDCFTNTVSTRLIKNFIDPDVPVNDTIVNRKTWKENYNGFYDTKEKDEDTKKGWYYINRADVNTVPLGIWITYKCLSNNNLGLRSEDRSYTSEQALMGSPRSFYPLNDASTKSANKINESWLINNGYSSTVSQKRNVIVQNIPYIKDQFDNRIMFSNVQVDGDFRNAYRIFQGLDYQDIERQYGAIVKLIPWGVNLFCVFEHGLGLIPINEKALIQTTTDQSIHMYGAGVIQNQISLISPDFGSIWPESVIRTPIGIYGVDTYAKKIWKYSSEKGLETISDMHIQRFLNDNIILSEKDKYPIIGLKNVKSHYNNYKGDIMFTFYNFLSDAEWNLCYNERMGKWITRYSWTPLYSENINNIFYSLDKKRSEVLSHIYDNKHCNYGIRTSKNEWGLIKDTNILEDEFRTEIKLFGIENLTNIHTIKINSISTSYIKDSKEILLNFDKKLFDQDSKERIIWLTNDRNNKRAVLSWTKSDMRKVFFESELTYDVPLYYKINITAIPEVQGQIGITPITRNICIVVDYHYAPKEYDELLVNGFFVHGRAGIFDEIKYDDDNPLNEIRPTKWYDKQEPFEFEFVVKEPTGLHKIFDNLVIISNNVQPKSLEFEVIGDSYNFKDQIDNIEFKFEKEIKQNLVSIKYDNVLNQKSLRILQVCKNITDPKYGRRLGNIHYKEDSWYITIDPILFKNNNKWKSTKIRDKFIKIRVKYSGDDLVIITALKTLMTLSYS